MRDNPMTDAEMREIVWYAENVVRTPRLISPENGCDLARALLASRKAADHLDDECDILAAECQGFKDELEKCRAQLREAERERDFAISGFVHIGVPPYADRPYCSVKGQYEYDMYYGDTALEALLAALADAAPPQEEVTK